MRTAARADVGDADNARALFERVLTEDANRRCPALWEAYLALEADAGDLGAALRLEKRARDALGDAANPSSSMGAGAAASSAGSGSAAGGGITTGGSAAALRGISLSLLRYQFLEAWPLPPAQHAYVAHLLGKGPAPPGFERGRRGAGGSDAGEPGAGGGTDWDRDRELGWGAGGGQAGAGHPSQPWDAHGGPPPPPWELAPPPPHRGPLPLQLDHFLCSLPPPDYLDGPLPDLNTVVDALYEMDPPQQQQPPASAGALANGSAVEAGGGGTREPAPPGGVKREHPEDEEDDGPAGRDVYRLRAKQRARLGGGDAA